MNEEQLVSEYQAYLDESKKFFAQVGVDAKQKKDVLDSFRLFLTVRRAWLQDDDWIKRNSSKLILTEMPNIWSDPRATKSFITSFCEDVCSVLNAPERKPKIYRKISDKLQLPESPSFDGVISALNLACGTFWN